MADNVTLDPGTGGAVIAADDISSVWHQRVKVQFGGDGSATDVSTSDGLPVAGIYSEDAATPATIIGHAIVMERDDALSALTPIEGDWVGLRGDANGALWVIDANSAAMLTALQLIDNLVLAEDAVHGSGDAGVMALAVRNDTLAALAGADGDYAPLQVGPDGALFTRSVTVIPGTGATNLGKAEAAADTTGDTGVMALAVRNDTLAALAGTDGDYAPLQVDASGAAYVTLAAGSETVGNVGLVPQTSGGLSIFRSIDLDETEEEAKGSAGQVFGWYIHNNASAVRYVKFYNATAASVTVGTTTPVLTIPVPANSAANVEYANGIAFDTAITVAATTGVADADTGAPAANDVQINLFYK